MRITGMDSGHLIAEDGELRFRSDDVERRLRGDAMHLALVAPHTLWRRRTARSRSRASQIAP